MRVDKKDFLLVVQYLVVPFIILHFSLIQLSEVEFPDGGVLDSIIVKVSGNMSFTILNSLRSNTLFLFNIFIGFALFCRFYDLKKEGLLSGILGAFILTSLVDYVLLLVLGVVGLYRPIPLFVVSLLLLWYLVPRGSMRFIRDVYKGISRNHEYLVIILLVFLLGLTPYKLLVYSYPVTLWKDVSPIYIAPAQMVVNFGKYIPLLDYPSSTHSRAKNVPGITALYSYTCAFSGVNVYKTVTPLVMVLFLLVLVSTYLLAKRFLGGDAAPWACLFLLFSGTYLRLGDVRGTVISFIYVAAAFIYLADFLYGQPKKLYLSAISTAFCFMVNPLIASILVVVQVFVFVVLFVITRRLKVLLSSVMFFSVAFIIGSLHFYQVSLDTGFTGYFFVFLSASIIGVFISHKNFGLKIKLKGINFLVHVAGLALTYVFFFYPTEGGGQMYARLANNFPLIAYLGVLGFLTLLFRHREKNSLEVIFLYGTVLVAGVVYFFFGQYYNTLELNPLVKLFFVEMNHKIDYWATYFLGFLSSCFIGYTIHRLNREGVGFFARLAVTSVIFFLVISPYSLKGDDIGLGRKLSGQGENTVSDFWMVAGSWIVDENRYWHPRELSPMQEEVVDKINAMIKEGEIEYKDTLLNINPIFGYLEELPSFTGVRELRVVDHHVPDKWGTGEGIHNISELDIILSGGAPEFLLYTVDSVDDETRKKLEGYYSELWATSDGRVILGELK